MLKDNKNQSAISLIELLLVLVVMSVIVLMGIRQYRVFEMDKLIRLEQDRIDSIFQAAEHFYQANCDMKPDPAAPGKATFGILNPRANPANPYIGDSQGANKLYNMLVSEGFLTQNFPRSSISFLYAVQFVRRDSMRTIKTADGYKPIGTIVNWIIQVIMVLRDPSKASFYSKLLSGDCLSTSTNPTNSCPKTGSFGNYVVFERLPSFVSAQTGSSYWPTNPTVNQFKAMYTTYPILYLINSGGNTPDGTPQYFLCGG